MNPLYVGDIDAHPKRPQVFNREYIVDLPSRRRRSLRETKKPWAVDMNGKHLRRFRTHAQAIRWADRQARKGKA